MLEVLRSNLIYQLQSTLKFVDWKGSVLQVGGVIKLNLIHLISK